MGRSKRCSCGDCFRCDLRRMGQPDVPAGERVPMGMRLAGLELRRQTLDRDAAYRRASRARARAAVDLVINARDDISDGREDDEAILVRFAQKMRGLGAHAHEVPGKRGHEQGGDADCG